VELRDAGLFADDSPGLEFSSMNEAFFSGQAAMMHGGSWSFAECPDEVKQHTIVSGFPLPADSPHQKPILPAGYVGKGIWITRNGSENLDAVEKFIKFFYQPEMIARFVEQAGMTPPLKDVPVDESTLDPLFLQSLQWGDSIELVEVIDLYIPTTLWEPLTKITKEAYLLDTPADKIVSDLDAAWEFAE
jgi:ABC-type glycerol-3-phosphate transport system substrate-binding protein